MKKVSLNYSPPYHPLICHFLFTVLKQCVQTNLFPSCCWPTRNVNVNNIKESDEYINSFHRPSEIKEVAHTLFKCMRINPANEIPGSCSVWKNVSSLIQVTFSNHINSTAALMIKSYPTTWHIHRLSWPLISVHVNPSQRVGEWLAAGWFYRNGLLDSPLKQRCLFWPLCNWTESTFWN